MLYKILDWDSTFFNYKVVSIDFESIIKISPEEILMQLKKDKVQLAYIFVNNIEMKDFI